MAEPWISAEQAAEHLGYALGTLYNKIADGESIPHRKVGRMFKFKRSELDEWVEAEDAARRIQAQAAARRAQVAEGA